MLPLAYIDNEEIEKSVKMSQFYLALMQSSPELATVVSTCPSLAPDENTDLSLYAGLELTSQATSLRKQSDKNLKLV